MAHGKIYDSILDTIGHTPLVRLNRVTDGAGASRATGTAPALVAAGVGATDSVVAAADVVAANRVVADTGPCAVPPAWAAPGAATGAGIHDHAGREAGGPCRRHRAREVLHAGQLVRIAQQHRRARRTLR